MESWCFASLDKGFASSNETVSHSESLFRNKNALLGWESKTPFNCDNNSLVLPNQQILENPGFPEMGIAEILRKQFPNIANSNAIFQEEDSSSKLASSMVDSNSRESSLIDLKLGGFGDNPNSNSHGTTPILCSAESSTPAKKARVSMSLSSQTAYCQVFGCNKDLTCAKDYHKRHKVCDVHSKTAKVIVNGIEQRFCQQCSRFHLLAEFDDGKRSCRKRLAGHNERRRKPQVGFGSNRSGRSLHSYNGSINSKFQGTTIPTTSFICQDILTPSHHNWNKNIKIEDEAHMFGQHEERSILAPYLFQKQYNSVFTENINQYSHEMVSRSLYQTNSLGSEDLTLFEGMPGMSESGCALSLLSSQSQNSPCHSPITAMHTASPSIVHSSSSSAQFSMTQVFGSQGLSSGRNYMGSHVMSVIDDGDAAEFGDGSTIDLLQLSSQLHRVENQRQSEHVKQENGRFLLS